MWLFKDIFNRRSNLKQCLHAYEEYRNSLNSEKTTLASFQDNGANLNQEKLHDELNKRKTTIENCTNKAIQFVQLAKVFMHKNVDLIFVLYCDLI